MMQSKKIPENPKPHLRIVRDLPPDPPSAESKQGPERSSLGKTLRAFADDLDRQIEEILRS